MSALNSMLIKQSAPYDGECYSKSCERLKNTGPFASKVVQLCYGKSSLLAIHTYQPIHFYSHVGT